MLLSGVRATPSRSGDVHPVGGGIRMPGEQSELAAAPRTLSEPAAAPGTLTKSAAAPGTLRKSAAALAGRALWVGPQPTSASRPPEILTIMIVII
jgi:hypothetical protein